MARIALGLRYDGSHYHGWQVQEQGVATVQAAVERALSAVANVPVSVTCAGRTDAGVHASGQVVHFDTRVDRSEHAWTFGANANLPNDISVLWAKRVDDSFSARFSATSRCYRYVLYNHDIRPGILRKAVGWYFRPLDERLIKRGAECLLGKHDFSAFRGSQCQANNAIRTIHRIEVLRIRRMVVIEVQANAFLLHMVRNIVGVLLAIGSGQQPPEWAAEVLASRDRRVAGVTVPPNGLYLVEANYPPEFKLPRMPVGPFFLP